jgi:uncharacterized protein (UPF0276 family)
MTMTGADRGARRTTGRVRYDRRGPRASMSPPPLPTGVGLGLRWEFLDDVLQHLDDPSVHPGLAEVPFFEISPENYMRRGGYYPAALERIAARWPIVTHGLAMSLASPDPLDDAYMRELRAFLARLPAPFHSDHLCFCGTGGRILHELLPLPLLRATAAHAAARLREAEDRLGRRMAVENITYYLAPGAAALPEGDFVAEVVHRSGGGLLLDVNNVFVNARNHGTEALACLRAMPLDRVVEIHVAGHERSDDDELLIDTHGAPVPPSVRDLLAWTLARTGPVPVLLERDHRVPPLDELLAERAWLAEAYDRAMAQRAPAERPAPLSVNVEEDRHEDDDANDREDQDERARASSLVGLVQRSVQDPRAPAAIEASPAAWLAASGARGEDADALARLGPRRLLLYRKLVRRGLARSIRVEIPRVAARLGGAFDRYVARFCDEELPRSRYLRDVAFELVAWAAPLWERDPEVPAYVADLARHELVAFEVAVAEASAAADPPAPLDLGRPVRLMAASRLARYAHAVHRLSADEGTLDVPERVETALLVYRDAAHELHHLELTPIAAALLERLLAREPLGDALRGACAALGRPLDAAVLEGTAALLADLAERGVLLGAG